jgi:protein NrfD
MIVIADTPAAKDRGVTSDPATPQASCMNSRRLMGFAPCRGRAFADSLIRPQADGYGPQSSKTPIGAFGRQQNFSGFAGVSAAAQFISDRVLRFRWLRGLARASQLPAAVAGAGLSTYTASLLSATSTPAWAAAPEALAVRFGASSVAAAAAALSLGERSPPQRKQLENVACAALATEAVATMASAQAYRGRGIAALSDGPSHAIERVGVIGVGLLLPLGLYAVSRVAGADRRLSEAASMAVLAGSFILRVSTLALGAESAKNPDVSFRFSQPANLRGRDRRSLARTASTSVGVGSVGH